ncbi:MAG: YigZ family protein [Saprospiraceae bacterium]|nr:YigZ family protein [Saprospiraceae bacterium]
MADRDTYRTLQQTSEGIFKDRGSKFFGYAKTIESETQANTFLQEIKEQHHKARHHCYAYQLLDANQFRYNDDGEPSGTAGKPIYNQILSAELKDVMVIVVRYFGGTKLGTSGLINAYKQAAIEAINANNIILKTIEKEIELHFDYALMGKTMEVLKVLDLNISRKRFENDGRIWIKVPESELHESITAIKARFLGRADEDINDDTEIEGLNILLGGK